MGLGLSTSWNAYRYNEGRGIVSEIKGLGFSEIELSFNLTEKIVSDIAQFEQDKQIKVLSLHNFCPIPAGIKREEALPDYYSIASEDEENRQAAVSQTKKTIDTACILGARAVVLHCGRVEIPDRTRQLISFYSQGLKDSREFKDLRRESIKERKSCSKPFFENTLKSLDEINRYAQKNGMLLGVETRFYYREIPSLEEIDTIFKKFKDSNIFYWHDTGHAQVMQNLGFYEQGEYLERYGDMMLGIHLHDVMGCRDHIAPFKGEFEFSRLKPYLKKDTIKIIEAHHPAAGRDLQDGRELLEKTFNGQP